MAGATGAALLALGLLAGCANPNTTVEVDPARGVIRFYDSKDNDLAIEGFDYARPDGPRIKIDSLKLRNNASDVRLANVEQMRIASEMTQAALQALLQAIPMLKPMPAAAPSSTSGPSLRERAGEALLRRVEEGPRYETERK